MEPAFSTVDHLHGLCTHTYSNCINVYAEHFSWLLNFFSERTHQTKINSSLSEPENLLSGVIQGRGIWPYVCYVHQSLG